MRISNLLASMIAVGFAAQAVAQETASVSSNEARGLSYSTGAESATLPTGVARLRLPYQSVTGNTSYDKDGAKSDSNATVKATGGAVVLEYGLSDDLSLQMKVDYRLSQTIKVTDKYRSDAVAAAVAAKKAGVYSENLATLAAATNVAITDKASLETALQTAIIGGCIPTLGQAACAAAYAAGTLKSDTLPASLTNTFGAGSASVSAKDYVAAAGTGTENKIVSGIQAAANTQIDASEYEGKGSLADTIVGVLYNPIKTAPLYAAVGVGVRLPTGNRNLANKFEQDATRSAYEFGVRWNIDYLPADWFMVSWQNQWEVPFAGTKREVGGVSHEMSRKGARNVGFVYLKPSLHVLHPSLDAVRTNFGLSYDYDNGEYDKVNGQTTGGTRTSQMWQFVGVGYSFLHSMKLPLQLDVDYEMPYKGTNVSIATKKLTTTLKGYYRF